MNEKLAALFFESSDADAPKEKTFLLSSGALKAKPAAFLAGGALNENASFFSSVAPLNGELKAEAAGALKLGAAELAVGKVGAGFAAEVRDPKPT